LQLIFSKEGAAVFRALAITIRGYLAYKSSRRITITKMERGRIQALDARGVGEKELFTILSDCRELMAYDDKQQKA